MQNGSAFPYWSLRPSQPQGSTLEPVANARTFDRASCGCFRSQSKNQLATSSDPSTLACACHSSTSISSTPQTSMRSCSASRLLKSGAGTTSWNPVTKHPNSERTGPTRKSSHSSCAYSSLLSSSTTLFAPPGLSSRLPSADVNWSGSMPQERRAAWRAMAPPGCSSGSMRCFQKSGSSCLTSPGLSGIASRHLKTSRERGTGHGQR
mmetsp:Transcript_17055/g.33327  ORF Transcript_17055/g.33327 Transcript_17055/m.33327 type:complete len:207 (+) Transcript_17055:50-670(+)